MSQIFNQVTVIPTESMEVVLLLNTGDILSPVMFSVSTKNFKTAEGRIPTSAISGWAEVNTIKKALNLPELTKEEVQKNRIKEIERLFSEMEGGIKDQLAELLASAIISSRSRGRFNFNDEVKSMFGDFFKTR